MDNIVDIGDSEELIVENTNISSDLKFSQKCIKLLEKYRKYLLDFKNHCICDQNIESEKVFTHLEEEFNSLVEEQTKHSEQESNCVNVNSEHNVSEYEDIDSNDKQFVPNEDLSDESVDYQTEDNQLSDEEFNPKIPNTRKRRLKREINGAKKKKKYVYYNFACDWVGCDRKYTKKDDLMAHISSCHTKEKPFQCEICLKRFAIEKFLKNHQKNHLNVNQKNTNSELSSNKSFVCDINDCRKVFNSTGNLKKHQSTTHSDERPYVCEWPGCSAAYKIKESLINHRAIHSDERQFKCDIEGCLKTFQTKWNYYSHMKAHRSQADPERARKYPCDWPGCQFNGKSKQDLTIHMNRHMNIKPYKCQSVGCEMSYFTSYELKQHKIKVHEVVNESEREFKCHIDGCQKRYAVERDLKRHLRRHDRIYVCSWPECGQRYAAKQLLSDHMDRHMNVKSFHCHFIGCGKSFFSKTNYESHMKKIHKYNCNKNNKK